MKLSGIFVSRKYGDIIRELYPGKEADRRIRKYGREKGVLFIVIVTAALLLSIPVFISDSSNMENPVYEIARGESGSGARTVSLRVRADNGYEDNISVNVDAREYRTDELEEYSLRLDDVLWEKILGDNSDRANVTYDLDLKEHIEGYPFAITWKTDRPQILSGRGIINRDKLRKEDPDNEGVGIRLCATCRYGDYSEEKEAYVEVHAPVSDAGDRMGDIIEASINDSDEESKNNDSQILPHYAGGNKLSFYRKGVNRGWVVIFLGIATAFMMMAARNSRIREKRDYRRKQIDSDYSNIVNQYALYYIAGMNPRSIWYSICSRYEDGPGASAKNRRFAYEEMIMTKKMMEDGCGELAAYDEFAKRCQNIRYRSFINFVKQSVIKGGRGLDEVLQEEIDKAQREKNNMIRTLAAEAETKLLLPMFMILVTVLAIVMIPALIGLNG